MNKIYLSGPNEQGVINLLIYFSVIVSGFVKTVMYLVCFPNYFHNYIFSRLLYILHLIFSIFRKNCLRIQRGEDNERKGQIYH